MNVIGYKETPEYRSRKWIDLLESKKSLKYFRNSADEQKRSIAAVDAAFYSNTLSQYVAA